MIVVTTNLAFGESADARQRAARLDESLGLLDALWSGEPVTVRGEYLTAVDVRMLPRPVQRPRIPVWCGGRWPAKRTVPGCSRTTRLNRH